MKILKTLCGVLAATTVVVLYAFLIYAFNKALGTRKDFWDIASTVGTWAAAIIALWLGIGQEVGRRHTATTAARLVAARLIPRMNASLVAIRSLKPHLELYDKTWQSLSNPIQQYEAIRAAGCSATLEIPTMELAALSPLPGRCALRLARAVALIELMNEQINQWDAPLWFQSASDDDRRVSAREWLLWARETQSLLESALSSCSDASE